MYNPLNIRTGTEGSFLTFPMELELSDTNYYCKNMVNYISHENSNEREVARYYIIDRINADRHFIIEAIKVTDNDYDLRYFEELEILDYDIEFMGIIGTSPFAYIHPKYEEEMEYDKVKQDGEVFEEQEYDLDITLEEDDSYKEWAVEDDNGWFYTVIRSTGILREFSDKTQTYSWIYDRKPEPKNPIYMLAEIKALKEDEDYEEIRPSIYIYEGRKLLHDDIVTT